MERAHNRHGEIKYVDRKGMEVGNTQISYDDLHTFALKEERTVETVKSI